ncbi:heparinase II/III family protein [Bartonella sp. DGB1]|uniref:heparinase II/III domain-containing protein n=1 Tax=Bartonella sp. DGB1 TaxID=3239807 RepID=UPI0035266248
MLFSHKISFSKTSFESKFTQVSEQKSFFAQLQKIFIKDKYKFNYLPIFSPMGDAKVAREIYHGKFNFSGLTLDTNGLSPFMIHINKDYIFGQIHNFSWLSHMYAAKSAISLAASRTFILDWIKIFGNKTNSHSYDYEITTNRIVNWLIHSNWLLKQSSTDFQQAFIDSIKEQAYHLYKNFIIIKDKYTKLHVAITLLLACRFTNLPLKFNQRILKIFTQATQENILLDGGHISLEPQKIYNILSLLIPIKQSYLQLLEQPPAILIEMIERLFPCLRFFTHTNGELAHFHGSTIVTKQAINACLSHDETNGAIFQHAPYSNFYRLANNNNILIANVGINNSESAMSFEFSSQQQRIIVNCNESCVKLIPNQYKSDKFSNLHHSYLQNEKLLFTKQRLKAITQNISLEKLSNQNKLGFCASHVKKYKHNIKIIHQREIFLDTDDTITGSDKLTYENLKGAIPSTKISFHLHPDIIVKKRLCNFLLIGKNNNVWEFSCDNAILKLDESIYHCPTHGALPSKKIILTFNNIPSSIINWKICRIKESLLQFDG